jgi:hypothetical protein
MLFSAQAFSSSPISALPLEIVATYNGEEFGFILTINQDSPFDLSIQREASYKLIVT